jgi:hypothetical protein
MLEKMRRTTVHLTGFDARQQDGVAEADRALEIVHRRKP